HAGVERVEAATGRQADWILLGERVDRRLELNRAERGRPSFDRLLPQPIVQERAARVILIRAGPGYSVELLEPSVAHPLVPGGETPQLVPHLFGGRLSPVAAEPAGQLAQNL